MFDVDAFVRGNDRWLRARLRHRIGARGGELDDVLQLAYVQLWRAARRIESDQAARAYCLAAAANIARDNARRREVVPAGAIPPGADEAAPDPADLVVRGEIRSAITQAVAELPPQQRRAWLGYEVHGMTYAALAAHLSLTPAAVRGLLHRARTGLQRNVELAEIAVRRRCEAIALHAAALNARTTSWSRTAEWPTVVVGAALVAAMSVPPGPADPAPAQRPARPVVTTGREVPQPPPRNRPPRRATPRRSTRSTPSRVDVQAQPQPTDETTASPCNFILSNDGRCPGMSAPPTIELPPVAPG